MSIILANLAFGANCFVFFFGGVFSKIGTSKGKEKAVCFALGFAFLAIALAYASGRLA